MIGISPICPYCGNWSVESTGKDMYPHRPDLYGLKFYVCPPCDAYVGTHKYTGKPLGRLANEELRKAKSKAHACFDPTWKNGHVSRGKAYSMLAKELHISSEDCHIGMFDVDMCNKVVDLFEK